MPGLLSEKRYPQDGLLTPSLLALGGMIGSLGPLSHCGPEMIRHQGNGSAQAWNSADRAVFVPFSVETTLTVYQIAWLNGTVSGNIDVGIYDDAQTLLVAYGTGNGQSGASVPQFADVADTSLPPGTYYMAMVLNNASGQIYCWKTGNHVIQASLGIKEQASAYPLPSTAAWSDASNGNLFPLMALLTASVV